MYVCLQFIRKFILTHSRWLAGECVKCVIRLIDKAFPRTAVCLLSRSLYESVSFDNTALFPLTNTVVHLNFSQFALIILNGTLVYSINRHYSCNHKIICAHDNIKISRFGGKYFQLRNRFMHHKITSRYNES